MEDDRARIEEDSEVVERRQAIATRKPMTFWDKIERWKGKVREANQELLDDEALIQAHQLEMLAFISAVQEAIRKYRL